MSHSNISVTIYQYNWSPDELSDYRPIMCQNLCKVFGLVHLNTDPELLHRFNSQLI